MNFFLLSLEEVRGRLRGVPERDLAIFARELALLVDAGLPLVRALEVSSRQTEDPYFKKVIETLSVEVSGGAALSDALAGFPRTFSQFFIHLVRSGETTGRLREVLEYLADDAERNFDLKSKVRGALAYPAFIISAMVVVGFIMITFVVPKLTEVLTESGATLPLATRVLIGTSHFFAGWWWAILLVAGAVIIYVIVAIREPAGRRAFDLIKLRAPIFGGLLRRTAIVRFARAMETLLAGGVEVPDALAVASAVTGNEVYRTIILDAEERVRDGHPLADAFARQSRVVPSMVTQLLAVGEETGKTKEVLGRLAAFYAREIDVLISNLVHLIEPVIMVVLGVAVGGMVAAVILPMYNLASQF